MKAGIIVMVSKDEMTTQEAEDRYHKRDCVEKAFEALKSHLGMDKIGVTTEGAMHGKGGVSGSLRPSCRRYCLMAQLSCG